MTKTNPFEYTRRSADDFTKVRRDLHAHSELGFEQHRTAQLVCDELTGYGIEHHAGVGKTGIVAVIEGRTDGSGRRVGLRADMDALPLQEENDSVIPLGAGFLAALAEHAMPA